MHKEINGEGRMSGMKPEREEEAKGMSLGQSLCSEGRRGKKSQLTGKAAEQGDRASGLGQERALRKQRVWGEPQFPPCLCAEERLHRVGREKRLLSLLIRGGERGQTAGGYGVRGR